MEEPKDNAKSKKRLIASLIISISLVLFTVSVVLSSTMFLSPESPEAVDTREIYAFEYQYFIFDETTFEDIELDLDFYWFDSSGNPIEAEYWYSECLDNKCEETVPMTDKEVIVVDDSEKFVKFIFAGDFDEDVQGVIDRNSRISDATFEERYQKYLYTFHVIDLKEFYNDSEILPMTTIHIPLESVHPYPTQKDQGKSGLAELDFGETVKDEPVIAEPKHDADNHTHDKVTMIPMTILDMVYFLNEHKEISDQDSGILMSYAVAKETGMNADEEVDHLAYHIMEKIE